MMTKQIIIAIEYNSIVAVCDEVVIFERELTSVERKVIKDFGQKDLLKYFAGVIRENIINNK